MVYCTNGRPPLDGILADEASEVIFRSEEACIINHRCYLTFSREDLERTLILRTITDLYKKYLNLLRQRMYHIFDQHQQSKLVNSLKLTL